MRKITKEAVNALLNYRKYSKGNTCVNSSDNCSSMYLLGNCIARYSSDGLEINHQGYLTCTTLERLRGLPGVHIKLIKGIWYLNGKEMAEGWNRI